MGADRGETKQCTLDVLSTDRGLHWACSYYQLTSNVGQLESSKLALVSKNQTGTGYNFCNQNWVLNQILFWRTQPKTSSGTRIRIFENNFFGEKKSETES
jgi:hypothetical protein